MLNYDLDAKLLKQSKMLPCKYNTTVVVIEVTLRICIFVYFYRLYTVINNNNFYRLHTEK